LARLLTILLTTFAYHITWIEVHCITDLGIVIIALDLLEPQSSPSFWARGVKLRVNSTARKSLFSDSVMPPEKLAYQESDVSSTINSYFTKALAKG